MPPWGHLIPKGDPLPKASPSEADGAETVFCSSAASSLIAPSGSSAAKGASAGGGSGGGGGGEGASLAPEGMPKSSKQKVVMENVEQHTSTFSKCLFVRFCLIERC